MIAAIAQARSFERPVQLLLLNQLTINIGFYMLMPYLAAHLSGDLGLAAWLVGLVLGVRNLTQQGMFLIGGTLADRLGYKRLIVAGCTLRTVGFGLLGFVDSLPALILASALTGFAGACSTRPCAPTSPTTPANDAPRPSPCSMSFTKPAS